MQRRISFVTVKWLWPCMVLLAAGCPRPPEAAPVRVVHCGEFSVELPGNWYRDKDVPRPNGVHLVKIRGGDRNSTINFYVYPKDSAVTPAVLNDYFFGELTVALKPQGTLTSEPPVAGELLGRPAVSRNFTFTLADGTAYFTLNTTALDLPGYDLLALAQIRDQDRERALRDLAVMLDSIKERSRPRSAAGFGSGEKARK